MAAETATAGARGILMGGDAEHMASHAGQPYRPSNSTEGDIFAASWCHDCRRQRTAEGNGCLIELRAWAHDLGDEGYPPEWVYGANGQPCCTAFTDKHAPRPSFRCKATDDLFGALPPSTAQAGGGR